MRPWPQLFKRAQLFPLVIGPVDGILTALTLAAGHILTPEQPIDISLALRIALHHFRVDLCFSSRSIRGFAASWFMPRGT
jgi:hypothetical protein